MLKYTNSLIQKISFNKKQFYIKRDDLLDVDFSGNKARKLYYFLHNDFKNKNKIISYGSAQSNTLSSLAILAKYKNMKLDFYVNHIATFLKKIPQGNYKKALENNANIISMENINYNYDLNTYMQDIVLKKEDNHMFIPEGASCKEAEFGIKILANEIKKWVKQNQINKLKIFLPSGTGTSSLFLQKNLKEFEVLTCACVGDDEYLKKQFNKLETNELLHPKIIKLNKKYHFGKLYKDFFDIHNELLKQTKIEFDLLYDSLGWITLEKYINDNSNNNKDLESYNILYIHQGGLLGNKSMKARYIYKRLKYF